MIEVHPELSFAALAGRVLDRKKSAAGVGQRVAALLTWRPDIASVLAAAPSRRARSTTRSTPWPPSGQPCGGVTGSARTLPADASGAPFIVV